MKIYPVVKHLRGEQHAAGIQWVTDTTTLKYLPKHIFDRLV
ncbi:hypothetical protein ACFQAT_08930 [Undibacterium arcticum]